MTFQKLLKILMVANFTWLLGHSNIALGKTVEKWLCSKGSLNRTVRLAAPEYGKAPCKVFYAKRLPDDLDDLAIESKQDAGEVKPLFYSSRDGEYCIRKIGEFVRDKNMQKWACSKLL